MRSKLECALGLDAPHTPPPAPEPARNRPRPASPEFLTAQGLTVDQILPVAVLAAAADAPVERSAVDEEEIAMVPIVSPLVAADQEQIQAAAIIETHTKH